MYFLGGINPDKMDMIAKFSEEKGYQQVDLLNSAQGQYYASSPSEFLYWIKNAELICTDSFHAVVFSVIFKRPFVVFDRDDGKSMNSRINTLLSELDLEYCRFHEKKSFDEYEKVDYNGIDQRIEIKKEQALSYLRRSLGFEE